jgi:phage recombination protein Bet
MTDKKITTITKPKDAEQPAPTPTAEVLTPKEQKEVRIIERVIENKEIAPQDVFGKLTRPQVELIKRTVAKGASDDELRLFIQVCKGANLNPFLKQVFLVPRWDSVAGKEVRAIQVSIDGFRAIAESSGAYAGNEDPAYDGEQEIDVAAGKSTAARKLMVPLKATSTVYKIVEGHRYAFVATARWSEYYPGPKMGFQWHIRPYLMLGKCAEALALRKAFPKLLSGMYAQEEMDKGQTESSEAEKMQKAFSTLMNTIGKASAKELAEYITKIKASDKYTEDQKAEFVESAEKKIAELTPAKAE